jgi:hypothetical protein
MPVRDPNKIDVEEALRIFRVWPDWKFVAEKIKRPNGTPYTVDAICKAVRRHDLQDAT